VILPLFLYEKKTIECPLFAERGMATGNSLSLVVSNILVIMEHFEEIALDSADHKPAKWLKNFGDTFVVSSHGPARLQEFPHHLSSLGLMIKFTMEVEINDTLPLLDVLVMKWGPKWSMKIYRKPTHTGRYLHFKSNNSHYVKRRVVYSLISRTKVICQDEEDFDMIIENIRHNLMPNDYPQEFVDS
jgi:hypothetical protein